MMHSSWIQRKINKLQKNVTLSNSSSKIEKQIKLLKAEKLKQQKVEWKKKYGNRYVNLFEKLENMNISIEDSDLKEGESVTVKINKIYKEIISIKKAVKKDQKQIKYRYT